MGTNAEKEAYRRSQRRRTHRHRRAEDQIRGMTYSAGVRKDKLPEVSPHTNTILKRPLLDVGDPKAFEDLIGVFQGGSFSVLELLGVTVFSRIDFRLADMHMKRTHGVYGGRLALKRMVEETARGDFPLRLEGQFGSLFVAGNKQRDHGSKFVSIGFKDSLRDALREERRQVISSLNVVDGLPATVVPHLSIAKNSAPGSFDRDLVNENLRRLDGVDVVFGQIEATDVAFIPRFGRPENT